MHSMHIAGLLLCTASWSLAAEVADIGSQRQLFVDDVLVDTVTDLQTVFHPPVRRPEPVLVADRPWEKPAFLGVLGNCVFYDEAETRFRMYYIIYQLIGHSERQHMALASSTDGLHWDKPALGVADYQGSRDNNLLWDYESPRYGSEFWTYNNVVRDPRDPDPARRYKALGMWLKHGQGAQGSPYVGYGMLVAFSPDGIRWTEPAGNPVLPNGDTHTLLGWDEAVGRYVAYPRTAEGNCGRCIGYSTSEDFLHWTPTRTVMAPGPADPPNYQIYGMPVFRYEGLYLGLPWAFIAAGTEPLDTQLAVSRDGQAWKKVANGSMFIPRGPADCFDDCYALACNPVRVGDELWFYYMGCGFPHGPQFVRESRWEGAIGLATLRLDGFVSLASALDSGGTVVTRPLRFAGRRMTVNCNCARGWLRVELQDAAGQPLPGFTEADCDTIRTDSVRQPVTWKGSGDVSSLAGSSIRVRLRLGDGELYSFGFEE
jgi:hypothetical protein